MPTRPKQYLPIQSTGDVGIKLERYYFCIVLAFCLLPFDGYSQEQALPQLSADMVDSDNGLLLLSTSDEWKYQPGDDLLWADPEFDDSGWYAIHPGELTLDSLPDSLWNGYGWWRYTFTADSSFYEENWNLYFSGLGAAEVYLDGQLFHRCGNFSVNPDEEKTYPLRNRFFLPVDVYENERHTIAVRYSYHQVKKHHEFGKETADFSGFEIGFGTLPQLSTDMGDENGFVLSNHFAWKYQPGDDLLWADPEFDDSGWYGISPGGLGIDEMPDSLWNGYGWWRFTCTADSSFYEENWGLYFYGWGAAEVYLDGKLLSSFGNFSVNPDLEKAYSPEKLLFPPTKIIENTTHTIAVRYSHHQAKNYNALIKENAEDLGFRFGFVTHAFNQYIAKRSTYQSFTLFSSAAVLFVLLLLHLMLFYKFPEDRSNLFIALVVGLLLISAVAVFKGVYAEVSMYWHSILVWVFSLTSGFAILFLPYATAQIFKLEKLNKVVWLTAGLPIIVVAGFLNEEVSNYTVLILFSISILLIGYICWKAYKSGKRGVWYVAFGALGTMSLAIIYMFYILGLIQMPFEIVYLTIAFLYTLFPLGMTLYVADSYGYLFTSLESEINDRTKKLKQSLEDLRATQNQLVQQEKLASLGQLTAGIAHEIKNPLNFVNNFSELNIEMVDEVMEELVRLPPDKADPIKELLTDVRANLQKTLQHGTRADGIVKSMLQHSRGGSGEMEPTNLNALMQEYVNLAFHGMRASKNPINVKLNFDLDENLGQVNLIGEDFSRVVLNLANNAFDAMRDKAKNETDYKAELTARTKRNGDRIEISITDNGPGIPEEVKDKILQPFFTTKKGTDGTGLGLSITNDIIKAHGGTIDIQSKPGETVFQIIIQR